MTRSARKSLVAVVALTALSGGWASAATLTASHDAGVPGASQRASEVANVPTATTPDTTAPTAVAPANGSATTVATNSVAVAAPPTTAAPSAPQPTKLTPGAAAPTTAERRADGLGTCGTPADGTYRPATEAEFQAALTHVWLLCQAPSFFGTGEAGLEVRADGTWSKLERKANGSLVRTRGWGQEGSWGTFDSSAMNGPGTYQANFSVDGGGASYTIPVFGAGGSRVRLDNAGVFVADYVVAPSGTVVVPAPGGSGHGCDVTESSYSPSTESEFRSAVTGVWLGCGTPSFFGTDEAGLEIGADGRWSKLQRGAGRSLVRLHGAGNEGTWQVADLTAMNGRPLFSINFTMLDGGRIGSVPALARQGSQVSKMRINNMGVFVADYIPAPPGTPIS